MAVTQFPILVLTPPARADAILSSGLIRRLHDEIPHARFTIVASATAAPLFRETPGLERLIEVERSGFGAGFGLWWRLRPRRWGLVLDLADGGLAKHLAATRKSRRPAPDAPPAHKVIQAARRLKLEDDPPAPWLFTSAETRARANELMGTGGPLLAVAPAEPWIGAAWPADRFARAAIQILGEGGPLAGGRLVMVGAPEDWREAEGLRRSLSRERLIDLSQEPDPLVIHACLERVDLFIGGAGWMTHLATAAGAPTLGLYGPTDDALEGVWGPRARVVRGPRSFEAIRAIDPGLNQSIAHMLDLKVEAVVEAAADLVQTMTPIRRLRRHG